MPSRKDLQELAGVRLREANVLLRAGMWDGAYYLAGYAAECGLKACIARSIRRYDFPDRDLANASYSHNLEALVKTAGLDRARQFVSSSDSIFDINWGVAKDWRETSRYERRTRQQAEDLVSAIADRRHGVLWWIRQHW